MILTVAKLLVQTSNKHEHQVEKCNHLMKN